MQTTKPEITLCPNCEAEVSTQETHCECGTATDPTERAWDQALDNSEQIGEVA